MKFVIEPFDKQPPEGWVLDEIGSHTVRFIPDRRHTGFGWNTALPHRPGDPLHGGVVERVEARQGKDITEEEWTEANLYGLVYSGDVSHDGWEWMFWLRED